MSEILSMSAEECNRTAQTQALRAMGGVALEPTSLVEFHSTGRVLIIGESEQALALARQLSTPLQASVLAQGEVPLANDDIPLLFVGHREIVIDGYFGAFDVTLASAEGAVAVAPLLGIKENRFDLVLDLNSPPLLAVDLLPLGYYAPAGDEDRLNEIVQQLPELLGDFEKPKYFAYDAAICAHGNSGLQGCTRCLDACPTAAITSLGERIAVDPYLCQGGGSCATACPSGAIVYRYPQPADTLNRLRVLLRTYREAGGSDPIVLFHDGEAGKEWLEARTLPAQVLPMMVEEIGSVGPEIWLAALAFGAGRVLLLNTDQVPDSVSRELETQLSVVATLLAAMGYAKELVAITPPIPAFQWTDACLQPLLSGIEPAGFAASNEKRNMLFFAVDWLHRQAPLKPQSTDLPAVAAFGRIEVDTKACTLCMACVSVCPAAALVAGGETPKLSFVETNCMQCGLCAQACPENAISVDARFLFEREQRRRQRVLHEEPPFCCIACGIPFATRSVIEMMTAKLSGHSMFQDEPALRRLRMCGDCRVKDMFERDYNP